MNSTLFGIYQLDERPEPHSTQERTSMHQTALPQVVLA
jgi:hypothetical protein